MFGNFAAQAGVISNSANSPNLITANLTWDFKDVIVMDFRPPGTQNLNDRPRINMWRSIDGNPDFNFLIYASGGKQLLSPAPTGILIEPWGDRRTGSYKFPIVSISDNQTILAGIDLFTFPWAEPIIIEPPLNQWITGLSNIDELQYQYKFKVGETNPQINIVLDYKSICKPINIPNCGLNQNLVYIGRNINNCPIFQCIDTNTFIEMGSLYNSNTWITGPGISFGNWFFNSGAGSSRNISNSTQNGRQSIGNQSFFIVGNTGNINNGHTGIFVLNSPMKSSGQFISLDVNYSWFGGDRVISFWSGNKNIDDFLRIFHSNSNGDALIYTLSSNLELTVFPDVTITGNAFNKAFTYKLTNQRTGLLFEVFNYGQSTPFHSRNIFHAELDRIQFGASLSNVPQVDWNNYGMYFNNIRYFSGAPNGLSNLVEIIALSGSCLSTTPINIFYSENENISVGLNLNTVIYQFDNITQEFKPATTNNYIYPTGLQEVTRYIYTVDNGVVISRNICTN